jgi:hypothetical protein
MTHSRIFYLLPSGTCRKKLDRKMTKIVIPGNAGRNKDLLNLYLREAEDVFRRKA